MIPTLEAFGNRLMRGHSDASLRDAIAPAINGPDGAVFRTWSLLSLSITTFRQRAKRKKHVIVSALGYQPAIPFTKFTWVTVYLRILRHGLRPSHRPCGAQSIWIDRYLHGGVLRPMQARAK